ncbi:MAG: 50S ribosomal protein L29 [Bacteroidales bacterium]|nr:50S ribosomal protein L29 [Bacteroidales bacterium]
MKKESLKELSVNDLNERLEMAQGQLQKMRLNHAASPLENPNLIRATRKNIARILTELRRRELEQNNQL